MDYIELCLGQNDLLISCCQYYVLCHFEYKLHLLRTLQINKIVRVIYAFISICQLRHYLRAYNTAVSNPIHPNTQFFSFLDSIQP